MGRLGLRLRLSEGGQLGGEGRFERRQQRYIYIYIQRQRRGKFRANDDQF